jgi:hypothetical protein
MMNDTASEVWRGGSGCRQNCNKWLMLRALSSRNKLELLQIIAHDLQQAEAFTEASTAFWSSRSLEAIAQSQSTPMITDIHALAIDFWPGDESADDFNQFIAVRRHADRLREA